MTVRLPTSLRFTHPDLDLGLPGLVCTAHGVRDLVTGAEQVRQSLLMLLTPLPGERVMRPDSGCELLTLAFWPNDDTTAGLAVHSVRRAIERFEPRVEVLAITATRQPDTPYRLDIRCEFQPRFGGDPQALTVGLDLDGRQED